ncbi:hypothetical protein HXX76_003943 [Chlamydomonas incerta]|uniref:NYN domain-containing protein n=1 Tax=Chlamydomonas incerta TaxID=51695 RepID=A0A835TBP3_CHLIN|nr:hypothetical protein HXX76_003943 [Chlamydomonas incerta]|eukprot:KAG2441091.1 hypothetical protein HXX76_003943 [Chlamydomonas incerta]
MDVALVPVRADAADMRLVQDAMAFASAATTTSCSSCSYEDTSSGSDADSGSSSRDGGSWSSTAGELRACGGEPDEAPVPDGLLPAVLCVSQDTDFAAPLRHLSERGVVTIAVSPHEPRRRTHAAMEPATYFRRLPLPSACWAALQWRAQPPAPVSAAEAAWLAARLQPPMPLPLPEHPPHAPLCHPQQQQQQQQRRQQQQPENGLMNTSAEMLGRTPAEPAALGAEALSCSTACMEQAQEQVPEAGKPTAEGAGALPRGLVEFAREGHPCPGAATRLWLNLAFSGTSCLDKTAGA